ncbi:MAG: hypothetical protein WCJ35_20950 [Planctomycetota bacterium]
MKCAMLIVLLLTTVALAQDNPAQEPAALVKARKDYEAEIKAAVDPITVAYLKKLDGMMKAFGAEGDLESAQIVQKEIKSFTSENTTAKPKSAIKRKTEVTIVGKWTFGSGRTNEFQQDGTVKCSDGNPGTWKCLDKKTRRYRIVWSQGGWVDLLQLSSDGATYAARNNKGGTWTATKLPTEEEK